MCCPAVQGRFKSSATNAFGNHIDGAVRYDQQRRMLYALDINLLALRQQHGESAETTALTGTYHYLLRMCADT